MLVEDRCGLFRSLDFVPSVQCGLMLASPTHEYEVSMLDKSPSGRGKSLSVPAKDFGQAVGERGLTLLFQGLAGRIHGHRDFIGGDFLNSSGGGLSPDCNIAATRP